MNGRVYCEERVAAMAASILHMHSNKPHSDLYLQIPMWKERSSSSSSTTTTTSASTKTNIVCSSKLESRQANNKRSCDTDVERKVKRRRPSISLSTGGGPPCDQLSPSSRTCSTLSSRSTVGTCGGTSPRLTERQQLALIIQMTAEQDCHSNHQLLGGSGARHVTGGSPSYNSGYSSNKSSSPRRASTAVSRRNDRGETPLHRAARRGDVKQTKKLIGEGADVNCRDNAGWTALHESCNHGRVSVARQLLKAGANCNALGYDDSTPLHDAASNGNILLVELLLRHGANPLLKNTDGESPIDVASTPEVVRLLRSEVIASSSSDDDSSSYDVRSPISPESFCDDTDMTLTVTSLPPPTAVRSHANGDEKPQQQQQHRHHPGFSDDDPAGLFSLTPPPEVNHVTVASRQPSPPLPVFRTEDDTHVDEDSPLPPLQIEYESAPAPAAAVTSPPAAVTSSQQQSGIYKKVTVTHHMDKSSASCGPRLTFRFQHIKKRDNISSSNNNNNNNALIKRNYHSSVADQSSRTSCKPPHGSDIGSHVTSQSEVQNDVTMAAISLSVAASPVSDADVASPALPSTTQTVTTGHLSNSQQSVTGRQFEDISDAEDDENLSGSTVDATKSTDSAAVMYGGLVAPSSLHWTDPLYPTYTDPMTYSPYSNPLVPLGGVAVDPISSPWQHDQMSSTGVTSLPLGVSGNTTLPVTEMTSAAVCDGVTSLADDVTQRATTSHEVPTQTGNSSPIAEATSQDVRIDDVIALQPPLAVAVSCDAQTGNDVTPTTPKIPRLKIVMSSASDSQHSTTSPAGSCSLPYVVTVDSDSSTRVVSALSPEGAAVAAVTSHNSGNNNNNNGVCEEAETLNVGTKHRRKIKHSSPVKVERDADSGGSKEPLETESRGGDDVIADVTDQQPSERRMTRSAMRQQNRQQQQQQQQQHGGSSTDNAPSETSGDQNNDAGASLRTTATPDTAEDDAVVTSHVTRRHHKHSKVSAAHRPVASNINASVASGDFVEMLATPVLSSQCKLTNPYAFYTALKKKLVEQQGELLSRPVTSNLPDRVNDYLMVRRDYQLHSASGTSSSSSAKQTENLPANLRELLTDQEQQRDELRLQHQQERVRLHLLAEQEMLRVHDRLLRVTSGVGTSLSLSACAMLRMSCATCPEDLNIDKLTRQTGKDLIGLMEQVEKKFDKLKDDMLVRQQHEADVLYSTHRLQWNWLSRSVDSHSNMTSAADNYIQLVAVDDHFNLFPA